MDFFELCQLKDKWSFNDDYDCWVLENVLYTANAKVPNAQRLNIFVPSQYMKKNGEIDEQGVKNGYNAQNAPIIFENNSAGYKEMPCVPLGHDRCYARQYLDQGYVYISCGNRGSNSVDENGVSCGKSPANLVDIKTALRYLRHNKEAFPGDKDKIISVGWSAGGAMSSLVAVTGNSPRFDKYLIENKAYMDESDAVFAAQIYCPIVDLEHADLAYEWMFSVDSQCEESHAGPAETMSPFKRALSNNLRRRYIDYFNSLNLVSVEKKIPLYIEYDGRSGTGYDYLIKKLNESAAKYLTKLTNGELPVDYNVEDYLMGEYTYPVMRVIHSQVDGKPMVQFVKEDVQGEDKTLWLSWDGEHAMIPDIDTFVIAHRRRMKPCTSFDVLPNTSGENSVFGKAGQECVHFDVDVAKALYDLKDQYPEEVGQYYDLYNEQANAEDVKERVFLYNPLNYIGTGEQADQPAHYRVNVGARDADTSLSISMVLACKLAQQYDDVSYNIIWEMPHSEADYNGEVIQWIESIVK